MIRKYLCTAGFLMFGVATGLAGGPENALVVINSESASSKLIGNHYIFDRQIPIENVVYLTGIPNREIIELSEFRKKILFPIIEVVERRSLKNQIDYVIYSSGFPTVVRVKSDQKKLLSMGDPQSPLAANNKILSPFISLTSATFFLRQIAAGDPQYLSLNANSYASKDARMLLTQPFVGEDADEFSKALTRTRTEKLDEAIEILEALAEKHPLQLAVLYWLARTYAWKGDVDNAIVWLKRSVAVGWCYRDYTRSDTAFAKLNDVEEFKTMLAAIPAMPFRYSPSYSFRSSYIWGPNGMINSTSDQGNQYILSTMLAVNRNKGNSEQEALGYLKRSVAADGTRPDGTFYFTSTKDVRAKTRAQGIQHTIEELRRLGFRGEIVTSNVPKNRNDVIGACLGTKEFNWRASGSIILPGAICENLTSFGGRLAAGTGQTKLSEFLRFGAAGSSGTVTEPYALQAKFPHPRIHTHYVRGCNLAESFYQSVTGPFQLLIVGDALCRPWARGPEIKISGDLESSESLSGEIEIDLDDSKSPEPIRATDIYLDGRLIRRIPKTGTGPIRVDSTTMPDGYHEFRFVPISGSSISTSGTVIAPFVVDNSGQHVEPGVEKKSFDINESITVSVSASNADSISLFHNSRSLANHEGSAAEFKIAAFDLGRGPVSIEARAMIGDQPIRSRPIQLEITGPISSTIPIIKDPPKRNKKKAAPKKKPAPGSGGSRRPR